MTRSKQTIEVVTVNTERRQRWSAGEKAALVRETYEPGMSVSLVARKHGVDASQLFIPLTRKISRSPHSHEERNRNRIGALVRRADF